MHASIWRFVGDPDNLLRRYDAMLAEIPNANLRLHLCLRAPDGIVLVDTCPSRDVYEAFAAGPFPRFASGTAFPIRSRSRIIPCSARSSTDARPADLESTSRVGQ